MKNNSHLASSFTPALAFSLFFFGATPSYLMPADASLPRNEKKLINRQINPLSAGKLLPDIKLKSASGHSFNITSFCQGQPSLLFYYRGTWCPYGSLMLKKLREIESRILKLGYQIIAVSPSSYLDIADQSKSLDAGFIMLSDDSLRAARFLGIAYLLDSASIKYYHHAGASIPRINSTGSEAMTVPALFWLDEKATIQGSIIFRDPSQIPESEQIAQETIKLKSL